MKYDLASMIGAAWFVLRFWGRPVDGPPCMCRSRIQCWFAHRLWSLRDAWTIGCILAGIKKENPPT